MLIPTKHESLEKNILVLGGDIIKFLKRRSYNIENLFQELKNQKSLSLNQFYNTIAFLWCSGIIGVGDYEIYLIK